MNNTISRLRNEMKKISNNKRATISQKFFKTGKGEYGEGDVFIGLTVPQTRKIAKEFRIIKIDDVEILLHSKIHEERLLAIFILIEKFNKSSLEEREKFYSFYIQNKRQVNNWDLVDSSADKIVGAYLMDRPKDILFTLARSDNIWERRIAMIACFHFIKNNEFDTALAIAEKLVHDKHDLIHKAVGWMLREIGKRSIDSEKKFLDRYAKTMPRTMLRYALEKFEPQLRKIYM